MITVQEVVVNRILQAPFLEEGLRRGIINVSALARQILPDVKREVMKEVSEGALVMAINRLAKQIQFKGESQRRIFSSVPDLMVRSNVIELTIANTSTLAERRKKLLDRIGTGQQYFLTFTQGIYETTIIASRELSETIDQVFQNEKIISRIVGLSALTVQLPSGTAESPGIYSFILKSLAWENINIIEVVSTLNEFTIILRDKDIAKAFSLITRLF